MVMVRERESGYGEGERVVMVRETRTVRQESIEVPATVRGIKPATGIPV